MIQRGLFRSSVGVTGPSSDYSATERHPIPIRRHEYICATRQKVSLSDVKSRKSVECHHEAFFNGSFIVSQARRFVGRIHSYYECDGFFQHFLLFLAIRPKPEESSAQMKGLSGDSV